MTLCCAVLSHVISYHSHIRESQIKVSRLISQCLGENRLGTKAVKTELSILVSFL